MNQSQFLAITCNSPEAREISRVHGAISFGFASHWLKNWRESFKPITKRRNRNHVITFDSHLKTALVAGTLTHVAESQSIVWLFQMVFGDNLFQSRLIYESRPGSYGKLSWHCLKIVKWFNVYTFHFKLVQFLLEVALIQL